MSHASTARQPPTPRLTKILALLAVLAVCGAALLYAAAAAFISGPPAAQRAEKLLGDILGQPVAIGRMHLDGATLTVEEITVSAPPSSEASALARIARLDITPRLLPLLAGKRQLRFVTIDGGSLSFSRSRRGEWNFSGIAQKFSGPRQTSAKDLLIQSLILRDCSVTVEGRGIHQLSVGLSDFSSKGSTASVIDVSGTVTGGGPFRIRGNFQAGSHGALALALQAPRIPLEILTRPFDKGSSRVHSEGVFGVDVAARVKRGDTHLTATIPLKGVLFLSPKARLPLDGSLSLAATYGRREDRATIDRCSLQLRELLQLEATAEVRKVRTRGLFSATASLSTLQIARLLSLAPAGVGKHLSAAGTFGIPSLKLSGDRRQGVTRGEGRLLLRDGSLAYKGHAVIRGCAADITLERKGPAWELTGSLRQQGNKGDSLIRDLTGMLSARFSPRFSPLSLSLSSLSAAILEGAIRGDIRWHPRTAAPFSASLRLVRTPLAAINRFLPPEKLLISQGSATATLEMSGRHAKDLSGTLQARFSGVQGRSGASAFSAGTVATASLFSLGSKGPALSGDFLLQNGMAAGKEAAAAFGYSLAEGSFSLSGLDARWGSAALRIASIKGPLPERTSATDGSRLPIRAEVRGAAVRQGLLELTDASGRVDAAYVTTGNSRWLEGDASLDIPSVSRAGRKLANAAARLQFGRGGATAKLSASVAGGQVTTEAAGDPFAPSPVASFSLDIAGLSAQTLSSLAPAPLPVTVSAGTLTGSAKGSAARATGIRVSFRTELHDLAVAKGRKTIFSRGDLSARGSLAGSSLTLDEAVLTIGDGITGRLAGQLNAFASPARSGSFNAEIPAMAINAALDTFANLLPTPLQQATAGGNLALGTDIRIGNGSVSLDGSADLRGITLEIPAQKIQAGAINGRLPFSMVMGKGGASAAAGNELPYVARKNYPELLQTFRSPGGGSMITVDRLQVGALEVGTTLLHFAATSGRTELVSLHTDLYGGALLGRGYLDSRGSFSYGANLLINDLSLRKLCDAIPAIQGYLSGKVDGLLELYRESSGAGRPAGRIDLWTRSDRDEKMLVSREFLQKLAGKNIRGPFFRSDRPFDRGEITVFLDSGYLTFDRLDISHTNLLGIRDLSVTVAPIQNRIALTHLLDTLKEAAARGKGTKRGAGPDSGPPETELDWLK